MVRSKIISIDDGDSAPVYEPVTRLADPDIIITPQPAKVYEPAPYNPIIHKFIEPLPEPIYAAPAVQKEPLIIREREAVKVEVQPFISAPIFTAPVVSKPVYTEEVTSPIVNKIFDTPKGDSFLDKIVNTLKEPTIEPAVEKTPLLESIKKVFTLPEITMPTLPELMPILVAEKKKMILNLI